MIVETLVFVIFAAIANAQNECNAYSQLESAAPCGPSGYARNYGQPNCLNFSNRANTFDARGKQFLTCTRSRLAQFVRQDLIAVSGRGTAQL
ncbi:hypothetical protein PENTCL1PPCAC_12170, partial [Pristionchus entomophagus]